MSSHPVSSTLRGPKFEDEIDVKRVSTSAPMNTWKIVPSKPVKKDFFEDKTLKSRISFTLQTANRFLCIGDQSLDPFPIEQTEPEVTGIQKPIKTKLKKKKMKKNKKVRKMNTCNISDSIKAKPSLEELEVKRCKKCFDNHFPSLPKFCRWAEEHTARMKRKTMKDNSTGSRKIKINSKNIEMIKARINLIEEQLHLKCISSHDIKNSKDLKMKKKKKKLTKMRIKKLEDMNNMAENAHSIFGCYPSQQDNMEPSCTNQEDKCSNNETFHQKILKSANLCVKKFENMNISKDKEVLAKFCIKKAKKLFDIRHSNHQFITKI